MIGEITALVDWAKPHIYPPVLVEDQNGVLSEMVQFLLFGICLIKLHHSQESQDTSLSSYPWARGCL